jgi:hypothetical protein
MTGFSFFGILVSEIYTVNESVEVIRTKTISWRDHSLASDLFASRAVGEFQFAGRGDLLIVDTLSASPIGNQPNIVVA